MSDRHVTRDFRNLTGQGGRELELYDHAEGFPGSSDAPDTSEGALWQSVNGWYQRRGEYWAPIYAPHVPGAVEALTDAVAGNVSCRPSGWGGGYAGPEIEAEEIIDDLCEAGWRLVFDEARP